MICNWNEDHIGEKCQHKLKIQELYLNK